MIAFKSISGMPTVLRRSGLSIGTTGAVVRCRTIATPYLSEFVIRSHSDGGTTTWTEHGIGVMFVNILIAFPLLLCALLLVLQDWYWSGISARAIDEYVLLCGIASCVIFMPVVRLILYRRQLIVSNDRALRIRTRGAECAYDAYEYDSVEIIRCPVVVSSPSHVATAEAAVLVTSRQAMILGIHSDPEEIEQVCNELQGNTGITVRSADIVIAIPAFWLPFQAFWLRSHES